MPQTQLRLKLWLLSAKKTESQGARSRARSSVKLFTATNCSFMHDTYNYSMLKSWIIGTIGCSSLNPSESLSCATSVGICILKKCLCIIQSICVTHSPYSLAAVINYNSSWTYCYHVYTLASWQYFLFVKRLKALVPMWSICLCLSVSLSLMAIHRDCLSSLRLVLDYQLLWKLLFPFQIHFVLPYWDKPPRRWLASL